MSYRLNSLKGGYIGDCTGDRGYWEFFTVAHLGIHRV